MSIRRKHATFWIHRAVLEKFSNTCSSRHLNHFPRMHICHLTSNFFAHLNENTKIIKFNHGLHLGLSTTCGYMKHRCEMTAYAGFAVVSLKNLLTSDHVQRMHVFHKNYEHVKNNRVGRLTGKKELVWLKTQRWIRRRLKQCFKYPQKILIF